MTVTYKYNGAMGGGSGGEADLIAAWLNPSWLLPGSGDSWSPSTKTLTVTGATTITADPGTDERPNRVPAALASHPPEIALAPPPPDRYSSGLSARAGIRECINQTVTMACHDRMATLCYQTPATWKGRR